MALADGDGLVDLFVANYDNEVNNLYHNIGNGIFEKVTNGDVPTDVKSSYSCAWVDADGDGMLDLFVGSLTGHKFYRNDASAIGGFTSMSTGNLITQGEFSEAFGVAWADYNLDGRVDAILGSKQISSQSSASSGGGPGRRLQGGSGSTGGAQGGSSNGAATGGGNGQSGGAGSASGATGGSTGGAQGGSSNGAGSASGGSGGPQCGAGSASGGAGTTNGGSTGGGQGTEGATYEGRMIVNQPMRYKNVDNLGYYTLGDGKIKSDSKSSVGVTVEDVNLDGHPDVFVVNRDSNNNLYVNDGVGGFKAVAAGPLVVDSKPSTSAQWGDLDGDGFPDVIVTNTYNSQNIGQCSQGACNTLVYRNRGLEASDSNGGFERLDIELPAADSVALADINGDGALDIMMCLAYFDMTQTGDYSAASNARAPAIYLNDGSGNMIVANSTQIGDPLDTGRLPMCNHPAFGDFNNDGVLDLFANHIFRGNGGGSMTMLGDPTGLSCYTCPRMDDKPDTTMQGSGCSEQGTHYCYASWVDVDGDGCVLVPVSLASMPSAQSPPYVSWHAQVPRLGRRSPLSQHGG